MLIALFSRVSSGLAISPPIILLSVLLLSAVGGCGAVANGPEFQPIPATAGASVVCLYRPEDPLGGAGLWDLVVNGKPVAVLQLKGYFACTVDPGTVKLEAVRKVNPLKDGYMIALIAKEDGTLPLLTVDAKPGQVHYLRMRVDQWAMPLSKPIVEEVPAARGQAEIKGLRRMMALDTPQPQ